MPEKYEGVTTAFPVESIQAQTQGPDKEEKTKEQTPGHDKNMDPLAVWTQFEEFDDNGKPYLRDYVPGGRLKNKTALITGGDSGIGRSTAMLFALEGCDVTIVYLPEEEKDAQDVKSWIEKKGRKCELIAVDLRKEESPKKIVEEHMTRFNRLDVLVNNAARQSMSMEFAEIDLKDVESTFRLNILAMFAVTKYALPYMKRGGSIINTTSVAAYMTNPTLVDYSSTKGAIMSFTKALALQIAPKGIRVNGVAPGIIYTPLQPASNPSSNMEELGKDACPMGRPGQPSEVASSFVFLASSESSYFTGQILHPNGGIEVQS
ncbi:Oxidoreductase, short-chain dehydrogenase/reductase family [Taphrina deformans PYCC 5710]|uniref:Oxidoreductase, short-chain dehydrogenase/reductase family n=1 Tax=Taphrina deformans (strain PYCC 5710 / ATCC 11124 / CBS 356.35 / IMI 108563 / JCM 9778 / NBRC 8474) TaxID=1097556 RepID=R4X9K6_TAPDE|nr:Oxidoreductase, short-chain dehydrogenase/reductase family [Taphrina deformans PYCC 5710]|eukprot:CCG82095.1 Oxidoreductase, short-chain dehydrogenase/reductase family [Taphrina deformans PYCC 5710]